MFGSPGLFPPAFSLLKEMLMLPFSTSEITFFLVAYYSCDETLQSYFALCIYACFIFKQRRTAFSSVRSSFAISSLLFKHWGLHMFTICSPMQGLVLALPAIGKGSSTFPPSGALVLRPKSKIGAAFDHLSNVRTIFLSIQINSYFHSLYRLGQLFLTMEIIIQKSFM